MKRLIMFLASGLLLVPVAGWGQTIGAVTHTQTSQYDLLKIDLTGDVCLLTVYPGDSYTNANQGEYVYDMCQRYSALAGINTDYFCTPPFSPPYGCGPQAMAYRIGHQDKCDRFRTSMAISGDNRISVDMGYQPLCGGTRQDVAGQLSFLYNAVGGGPLVIDDGVVLNSSNSCENFGGDCSTYWNSSIRHSVGGVTADGRWLYLLATRPGVTATLNQIAVYLQSVGVYRALKFDGGGSSQMVFNGSKLYGLDVIREVVEGLIVIDGSSGRHGVYAGQNMSSTPTLQPGDQVTLSVTYQNDGVMPWERTTVVSSPSANPGYVEIRSVDAAGNEAAYTAAYDPSWISPSRITPAGAEFVGQEGGPNQATFAFTGRAPSTGGVYTLRVAPFCRTGRIPGAAIATFIINVAGAGGCAANRIIPNSCVTYPATPCYPAAAPNLQTLPDQKTGRWMNVGQPIRGVFKTDVKYSISFEYEAETPTTLILGLGGFNPKAKEPSVIIGRSDLPAAGEWKTFWSGPFTPTAGDLDRNGNLKLIPSVPDGFMIRNVRVVSYDSGKQ